MELKKHGEDDFGEEAPQHSVHGVDADFYEHANVDVHSFCIEAIVVINRNQLQPTKKIKNASHGNTVDVMERRNAHRTANL